MGLEAWVPPYDDWAKTAEREAAWFIKWRSSTSDLGFDFLYQDGQKRPEYPRKDDWNDQEFPVNYASDWAKNRKPWEVWLDAFDAWDHERKRLCEVYLRKAEAVPAGVPPAMDTGYAGKFPQAPQMPESMVALYQAAYDGDVVKLADMLEDEEVDLCCKDHNLQTPTMFAAQGGSLECVEYLVDMGADLAAVDRNKDTAYDITIREHAERSPHHPVLRYFQSVKAPKKG